MSVIPLEAASVGSGDESCQESTKDRGHWELTGLSSFMPYQLNSFLLPNICFTWISKKNNGGRRVMERRGRHRETPKSMKHVNFCLRLEMLLL